MKYQIKHYHDAYWRRWTLQYYWGDEGGGGWSAVASAPWPWILRLLAPLHKNAYDRESERLGNTQSFEL